MFLQYGGQRARLLGKLAAGLGPDKPGLAGFGKAHLKRCIAAKLWQVVIRPGNRGHAQTKLHNHIPFTRKPVVGDQAERPSALPASLSSRSSG